MVLLVVFEPDAEPTAGRAESAAAGGAGVTDQPMVVRTSLASFEPVEEVNVNVVTGTYSD
jgi:hypothetical protein